MKGRGAELQQGSAARIHNRHTRQVASAMVREATHRSCFTHSPCSSQCCACCPDGLHRRRYKGWPDRCWPGMPGRQAAAHRVATGSCQQATTWASGTHASPSGCCPPAAACPCAPAAACPALALPPLQAACCQRPLPAAPPAAWAAAHRLSAGIKRLSTVRTALAPPECASRPGQQARLAWGASGKVVVGAPTCLMASGSSASTAGSRSSRDSCQSAPAPAAAALLPVPLLPAPPAGAAPAALLLAAAWPAGGEAGWLGAAASDADA